MRTTLYDIRSYTRDQLTGFVAENLSSLLEDEALAVLDNIHCSSALCQKFAQDPRLTAYYAVRVRLVAHRATPQAHAVKFVNYLYWRDLVRLSVDVRVPAPVRRSIDRQLLFKIGELSIGERIASAKRCSTALIKKLLFDEELRVFVALLNNSLLREEDLMELASSPRAGGEQLDLLGRDRRWSHRYAIRKALVLNPRTPRSTAASQLRFLAERDLLEIHSNPDTSVYLKRCIERVHHQRFGKTRHEPSDQPDSLFDSSSN